MSLLVDLGGGKSSLSELTQPKGSLLRVSEGKSQFSSHSLPIYLFAFICN